MKLEELINKQYQHLNENDLYIWDYISKHRKECEKISIDMLANKCHVSRSTILRFTKRLGLKGYSEFKVLLSLDNQAKQKSALIESLYDDYLKNLKHIRDSQYKDIVKSIDEAENLFVYGTGEIQESLAQYLKRAFLKVEKLFLDIDATSDLDAYMSLYRANDVFIAISYSGENKRLIDYIYHLKSKGVIVVTINAHNDCTLAHISDYNLYVEDIKVYSHFDSLESLLGGYFVLIDFIFANYINYASQKGEK